MHMRLMLTALVFLIGLFFVGMALAFVLTPLSVSAMVAVNPAGDPHTMSTLRGDFAGFFGIVGISALWGAWKCRGDLLLLPALAMIIVVIGRFVGYSQDGGFEGLGGVIALELLFAAIFLWARSVLPHHALKDVGD